MASIHSALSRNVMHVVMQRPSHQNALTTAMYDAMTLALDHAEASQQVKVLMFSGVGRVFTTGSDPAAMGTTQVATDRFMEKLAGFSKPLIAAVEGLAAAEGLSLLLHCDLVYAADNAMFAGVRAAPNNPSDTLCLARLMHMAGHQHGMETLCFGEPFTAARAHQLGFVNRVLPADDVLYYAICQSERLAQLPEEPVRSTKSLTRGRTTSDGIRCIH